MAAHRVLTDLAEAFRELQTLDLTGQGPMPIKLKDNTAAALSIKEATNNYITINTSDSAESIAFGVGLTTTSGFTANGNVTANAVAATAADGVTANSVILPQKVVITANPAASGAARGDFIFTADRAYTVLSIKVNYQVVSSGAAYMSLRKITADGVLANAAAGATCIELQSAPTTDFDLTATAATTRTGTLSAVSGAITLAAGNKIGLLLSAATTGLVGCNVTITLQCV